MDDDPRASRTRLPVRFYPLREQPGDDLSATTTAEEANMEQLEWYEIDAVVAPERIGHREWREATVPRGRIPKNLTRKERMRRRLRTKRGRAEYDKRKITAEPVCGQLKTVQGLRQFLLRGLSKVRGEFLLASTGHNLLKLFRSRTNPMESSA
jgi:hypothetical protein